MGREILPRARLLPATTSAPRLNLDQMGGSCSISAKLESTAVPDPYGIPSPLLSAPFSIGAFSPTTSQ